jgi:hypothetical protein
MNITLAELSFASFVFRQLDNGSYQDFRNKTNNNPDLSNSGHRENLLLFLKRYGCRQRYNKDASRLIENWYAQHCGNLPDINMHLWELTSQQLCKIYTAFTALSALPVVIRKKSIIRLGQIPAAKAIFAIRPKALFAWDNKIRKKYVGKNGSYKDFLEKMRGLIPQIRKQCERQDFKLHELPNKLNKPDITIPKLIDEYNWITITRGLRPTIKDFHNWYKWSIVA